MIYLTATYFIPLIFHLAINKALPKYLPAAIVFGAHGYYPNRDITKPHGHATTKGHNVSIFKNTSLPQSSFCCNSSLYNRKKIRLLLV